MVFLYPGSFCLQLCLLTRAFQGHCAHPPPARRGGAGGTPWGRAWGTDNTVLTLLPQPGEGGAGRTPWGRTWGIDHTVLTLPQPGEEEPGGLRGAEPGKTDHFFPLTSVTCCVTCNGSSLAGSVGPSPGASVLHLSLALLRID